LAAFVLRGQENSAGKIILPLCSSPAVCFVRTAAWLRKATPLRSSAIVSTDSYRALRLRFLSSHGFIPTPPHPSGPLSASPFAEHRVRPLFPRNPSSTVPYSHARARRSIIRAVTCSCSPPPPSAFCPICIRVYIDTVSLSRPAVRFLPTPLPPPVFSSAPPPSLSLSLSVSVFILLRSYSLVSTLGSFLSRGSIYESVRYAA